MTEYALSTNLYGFAAIRQGFVEWPASTGEAEVLRAMQLGDLIVPKFAASADLGLGDSQQAQQTYTEAIGLDPAAIAQDYITTIGEGARAVPFILSVVLGFEEVVNHPSGSPWTRVSVETEDLPHPLSTHEFLRLRAVPLELAAQFKGIAAPGRHIQELPPGTVKPVRDAGSTVHRGDLLRQYSVVDAPDATAALVELRNAGRSTVTGDRVFIASHAGMLGVHEIDASGELQAVGTMIARTPHELLELFQAAKARMTNSDGFAPNPGIGAAKEIISLVESPVNVVAVDNFARFHDRYVLLSRRVNQALEIEKRPLLPGAGTASEQPEDESENPEAVELDELAALNGLDIDAVRKTLPPDFELPDSVLGEAVTALRAGKHLLLSGPPGTGKTTLARALSEAVVQQQYDVATATADWTTFDTIGGYMPTTDNKLSFEPGIVLRCLNRGWWLIIDELNRADIDKAFGPLFTLLSGDAKASSRGIVLPFQEDGHSIEITRAETRAEGKGQFILTPGWRLLGTLNVSDKASLFQLSFAFLRRFAVIDVPLPSELAYRAWFTNQCLAIPEEPRDEIVEAAMRLAFGPVEIGPAILADIARFVAVGLTETSSGAPTYADPIRAFLTGVRLYAVPQYEGRTTSETSDAIALLRGVWPDREDVAWAQLAEAMSFVAVA